MSRNVAAAAACAVALAACSGSNTTTTDAGDAATGSGGAHEFVEDFLSTSRVDTAATTATVDTTPPGLVHGEYWPVDENVGDGHEGVFATGDAGVAVPVGEHQYDSMTITNFGPMTTGDVTLRVRHDLVVSSSGTNTARLFVRGNLTLVVGGALRLESGGSIYVEGGKLTVHQPGTQGITVSGTSSYMMTGGTAATSPEHPNDLDIRTRGAVRLVDGGYLETSAYTREGPRPTGSLWVRAYGDVTLGPRSFVQAQHGEVGVYTEGNVALGTRAFIEGLHLGGNLTVRARGSLSLGEYAFMECGDAALADVAIEGPATFGLNAFVDTGDDAPSRVSFRAGSLAMTATGAFIDSGRGVDGQAGGGVDVRVHGPITIQGGMLKAGDGGCMPGGDLRVEADGDIRLNNTCLYGGEWDETRTTGCTPARGGNISVRTTGRLIVESPKSVCPSGLQGGAGMPTGTITLAEQVASPLVGPIDAGLRRNWTLQSIAVPLGASTTSVTAAEALWHLGMGTMGEVLVSPDGSEQHYLSPTALRGTILQPGFRVRATMSTRLLDAAVLDRVRVAY